MARKPKLLVLSTDSRTRQLTPRRLRVSIACLYCRKKKRRCDGNLPCLHCQQNSLQCQYPNGASSVPPNNNNNISNNVTPFQSPVLKSISNPNSNHTSRNTTPPNTSPNSDKISSNIPLSSTAKTSTIPISTASNIPSFKEENRNFTLFDNIINTSNSYVDENIRTNSIKQEKSNSNVSLRSLNTNVNNPMDQIDYKRIVVTLFTKENLQNIIRNNANLKTSPSQPNDINEFLVTLIDRNINKDGYLNLNEIRMGKPSILPPRNIALKLILKTWNYACVLFRFYHRPTIIKILDSLYENKGYPKTLNEIRAEALIYAVLAVGALFSKDDPHDENDPKRKEYYGDEGFKFFLKSKQLIDFADVSDIYSIQTLFMLTLFLQCSANLKSCYHYIGIALRSAIKEGLYKSSSLIGPTAIEDETKKRLFWSIYKVDIYMNCILGLPSNMNEDKIDQELPLDVDDERITSNGILESTDKQPFEKISSCGMNNEHTKLVLVMSRIYEYTSQLTLSQILHRDELQRKIYDLENQLDIWYMELPAALRPDHKMISSEERDYYLKPQKLLQLDFLLTKLTLYKPFFHFITLDVNEYPNLKFQIKMSTNCIKISIEIIRLSYDMINMDLLNGTYWYSIHTIYYSFACLTIYKYQLMERGDHENRLHEIENVCDLGYKILIELQKYSRAGKRILKVLELIFKQFNDKFLELNEQLVNNLQNFKHNNHKSKTHLDYDEALSHPPPHHHTELHGSDHDTTTTTTTSTANNYFNITSTSTNSPQSLEHPHYNQSKSNMISDNNNNNNNNSQIHETNNHNTNTNIPLNNNNNTHIGRLNTGIDNNSNNTNPTNNLLTNPDDNADLIFNSQNFLNKLLEELEMEL